MGDELIKLSVSMPIYNAGKYLDQSISSVMSQSYKEFELILVDDGSKDDSVAICKTWQAKYPDVIRVVTKENSGSLLTRKRCIEESRYDYLYIMDADDYLIRDDALKKIVDIIASENADLVFFDNCSDDKTVNFDFGQNTVFEGDYKRAIYDIMLSSPKLYPLWNKVFRKNLVDFEKDYEDFENIIYGTDLFQTIPIISRAKKIVYLKECLYFYRYEGNSNSIVHKFKPESYITAKKNQIRLEKYAHKYSWNVDDLEKKLSIARMKRISTAIYKVRLIKKSSKNERYEYLKSIGDDQYFVDHFSLKGVQLSRKIILIMVRMKMYSLLAFLV